jgi:propanol-preferring alcohol dehydrogenase
MPHQVMRAIRFVGPKKPLGMQEVPVPDIGEHDVLVRVKAAGICRSDVHYRAGTSPVRPTPLTLGHEVAGIVDRAGARVGNVRVGDRVCLHYNITCGDCLHCSEGRDQFCEKVLMLGHYTDGGFAEYIAVPGRNAIPLPHEIPFDQGATLMCASATSYHALRKGRLRAGERVAVFGVGGLGHSALQLARAFGALEVYAVDMNAERLALAHEHGAVPVDARQADPVAEIRRLTDGHGVDVALEMIGLPQTMRQAIACAATMGRVVIVGISGEPLEVRTYTELVGREVELIGCNDHQLHELPLLVELARRKILDTGRVVTRTVPLDAARINGALDDLERFGEGVRTVVEP